MKKIFLILLLSIGYLFSQAQSPLYINKYLKDTVVSGLHALYFDTTHTGQWKDISNQAGGGSGGTGYIKIAGISTLTANVTVTGWPYSYIENLLYKEINADDGSGNLSQLRISADDYSMNQTGVNKGGGIAIMASSASSSRLVRIYSNSTGSATSLSNSSWIDINPDSLQINIKNSGKLKFNNLSTAPGTKALRIDATGKISMADTTVGAGGSTTLAGLTDVNISGIANNNMLTYQTSDSKWHNVTGIPFLGTFANGDLTMYQSGNMIPFTPTYLEQAVLDDTAAAIRNDLAEANGIGTYSGTGAYPIENVWRNTLTNRLGYRGFKSNGDTIVFRVPITDSTIYPVVSTDYTIAFSIRKKVDAYAGAAMTIRRSSDNAEVELFFDGSDEISGSSLVTGGSDLTTWKGGSTLFVKRWYNQMGDGNDAVQLTAGNQPTLELSGINSKATVSFDGADDYLSYTAPFSGAGARSIMAVYKLLSASGEFTVVGQSVGTTPLTWFVLESRSVSTGATGHPYLAVYAGDLTDGTAPSTTNALVATALYTGTVSYLRRNGTQIATTTQTLNTTTSNAFVGRNIGGGYMAGYISEILMTGIGSAPTADETDAESFYAIP